MVVEKTKETAILPKLATTHSNGYDLYSPEDFTLNPGEKISIDIGIKIHFPPFLWGKLEGKSGLAKNFGIITLGGVLDESYRGPVIALLMNTGDKPWEVKTGDKICQMILLPSARAQVREGKVSTDTERGENGFGSTGKR